MPVALASDEERLAGKRFDALDAAELAQLYRLMARLELATPLRRTRRHERGAPRPRRRPAAHPAREPAHRRRAAAARAPAAAGRAAPARDAVRHLGLDGALRARVPAVPRLRRRQRPARRGVRVRHAADAPDARARRAQPGARDPARRRGGAGLVERHAHRRRAEGVQRPPRPARDGARRGRRDPLRRLGARRPGARRARDGAARAARPPDRVGQPARERERVLGRRPAAWSRRCRTATRSSAATASRALAEVADAIGGAPTSRRPSRAAGAAGAEPWASATPVPGSSVAMPSGHGPSRGNTTPGWVTDE